VPALILTSTPATCRTPGIALNCGGCRYSPLEQKGMATAGKITPKLDNAQFCTLRAEPLRRHAITPSSK
jgi:hypothetical protein